MSKPYKGVFIIKITDKANLYIYNDKTDGFKILVVAENENDVCSIVNEYINNPNIKNEFDDKLFCCNMHNKILSISKNANKIEENDITEFIGQIIDIFEDFLNDKNVILNDSKQNENENFKTSNHVNICGTDYDILQKHIKDTLHNWKIISE